MGRARSKRKGAWVQPCGWTSAGVAETGAVETCKPSSGSLYRGKACSLYAASWRRGSDFPMHTELSLLLLPLPLPLLLTQRPLPFGMVSKGKAAKRRRWRMQRAAFEEVARLAAPFRGRESQCHDGVQRGVEALRPPWSSFPPAFQSWARCIPAAICRISPHQTGAVLAGFRSRHSRRWSAVHSCGESPHPTARAGPHSAGVPAQGGTSWPSTNPPPI